MGNPHTFLERIIGAPRTFLERIKLSSFKNYLKNKEF